MFRLIKYCFLLALSAIYLIAPAQNKLLTPEEMMTNPALYPSQLRNLQWIGNTGEFTFTSAKGIIKGSTSTKDKDTLLRLSDFNNGMENLSLEKIKRCPAITWISNTAFYFTSNNQIIRYDLLTKKFESINKYNEKAENEDIENNTLAIAYTLDNNLYISCKGKETAITSDTNKGIVNGSERVHRNEWGISKGTFWSPKGNRLAFYRMDETMVADYPLVNINTRIATVENTKYPMAGEKSHHVTVGVYNLNTKSTIFLKTGEPEDQFLTNITWSPDEKRIYIAVLNRGQNHLWLNEYDADNGNFVKTLFEETSDKYVEPLHGLYFLKNKPTFFVWQSQRDGYNHLYLYDVSGRLVKQLTKGNWAVTEMIGFNEKETKLFYLSTEDSPIEQQIYTLDMKNGKTHRLSSTSGTHSAFLSANGDFLIDQYSNYTTASEYRLMNANGKELQTILENKNPLQDYKLGKTSVFTLKSKDGTDLYCRMIKPVDFDSTKKYPVFIYVYGGPHSQMVNNSWLADGGLFLNYMAEKGYLVFTMDNHGTSNRGLAFEQAIFRNLGTIEVDDQMLGVKYLKTLPYADTTRFGLDGWSYGGFMTISLMLKNPGVFKCATAGGPVIDWKYYEVMYGERYMDTPQENPEGYENACLLNYVDNLKGKLLIMHGTIDNTVVWQNSLMFLKKCVEKGKQVDYFVYPDHEHNVRGPQRAHLIHKIEDYHNQNQ